MLCGLTKLAAMDLMTWPGKLRTITSTDVPDKTQEFKLGMSLELIKDSSFFLKFKFFRSVNRSLNIS